MKIKAAFQQHTNLSCFLLIFLSFFLTSAGYLSWLYHMMNLVAPVYADLFSMVFGYLAQAAGIAIIALYSRRKREILARPIFLLSILILYMICLLPSVISRFTAGTLVFGYLMNFLCGMIAAWYLHALAFYIDSKYRGRTFGSAYAAASVAAWLLSLLQQGSFLRSGWVLYVYLGIAALIVLFVFLWNPAGEGRVQRVNVAGGSSPEETTDTVPGEKAEDRAACSLSKPAKAPDTRYLLLGIGTILLLNLVKNLGFSFPSADVSAGLSIELSRIFYAAGLVIAGFINDKSRKAGAICALAGLVIPFVMLALSGEPLSAIIFWALEYFFFGFFSVYRVIFFADLAETSDCWYLSGFGILFGHSGDAIGTAASIWIGNSLIVLVLITVVLFIGTIFLFFLLYQKTYSEKPKPKKSETEIFDDFALAHDLSSREREVLRQIIAEKSNSEIAEILCVSESTVKFHVRNLLKKTACKNRIELMAQYVAEGRS